MGIKLKHEYLHFFFSYSLTPVPYLYLSFVFVTPLKKVHEENVIYKPRDFYCNWAM